MLKVPIFIAATIMLSWIAALLLNIDIYRKANIELSVFGPITDATILMIIALVIFLFTNKFSKIQSKLKWVNISLLGLSALSIIAISYFYVLTFR